MRAVAAEHQVGVAVDQPGRHQRAAQVVRLGDALAPLVHLAEDGEAALAAALLASCATPRTAPRPAHGGARQPDMMTFLNTFRKIGGAFDVDPAQAALTTFTVMPQTGSMRLSGRSTDMDRRSEVLATIGITAEKPSGM